MNIHDPKYLRWWASKSHRAKVDDYNQAWREFIDKNPNAPLKAVKAFGAKLMKNYGFEDFKW